MNKDEIKVLDLFDHLSERNATVTERYYLVALKRLEHKLSCDFNT